jgi:hypothetical protein
LVARGYTYIDYKEIERIKRKKDKDKVYPKRPFHVRSVPNTWATAPVPWYLKTWKDL